MRSDKRVHLAWTGEGLVFRGGAPDGPRVTVDSDGEKGPSPTDALLLSLAGCMGVDVRLILEKSRVPVSSLEVEADGERATQDPRRFTRIRLVYTLEGPEADDRPKVERAVALSREKYCSVLHTLRPDLDLEIEIRLT